MSRHSSIESLAGPWIWKRGTDDYDLSNFVEAWAQAQRKEKMVESGYAMNYFTNMWGIATSGRDLNARVPTFFGPVLSKGTTGVARVSLPHNGNVVSTRDLDFPALLRKRIVENSLSAFDKFSHQAVTEKRLSTELASTLSSEHNAVVHEGLPFFASLAQSQSLRGSISGQEVIGQSTSKLAEQSVERYEHLEKGLENSLQRTKDSSGQSHPVSIHSDLNLFSSSFEREQLNLRSSKVGRVQLKSGEKVVSASGRPVSMHVDHQDVNRTILSGSLYINAWVRHYSMFQKP
jgi:hypothetical protein